MGELGDRTFGLWQEDYDPELHLTVSDPHSSSNGVQRSDNFACTDGEWATYSVEVTQVPGDPAMLQYTTKINGNDLYTSTYAASVAPKNSDLQIFVADDFYNPATGYSVRNFFYQTFEETCVLDNEAAFTLTAKTSTSDWADSNGNIYLQ